MPANLLRGERVYLSAWTEKDVEPVTEWYQHSEFMRLLDAVPAEPRTAGHTRQWMQETAEAKNHFSFAVRTTAADRLVGLIEVEDILWTHGSGWPSIAIGNPADRGKGYGTEALHLILRFAFHELNLHRVQLTVFETNSRAIALYESMGFSREGIFREAINRDGRRSDMLLYGMLRDEWETYQ